MSGRALALALVVLAIGWPAALGAALVDHLDRSPHAASFLTYLAAGHVCHQRPERSFFTDGVKWPVCGRCSGLYLAAPLGALTALATRRPITRKTLILGLVLAAGPTAATIALEWTGAVLVTSVVRMGAAVPLGAALGVVLVWVARGDR